MPDHDADSLRAIFPEGKTFREAMEQIWEAMGDDGDLAGVALGEGDEDGVRVMLILGRVVADLTPAEALILARRLGALAEIAAAYRTKDEAMAAVRRLMDEGAL